MQVWQNEQEIKNGRFRVQKVLGAGGFGVTYLVLEQATDRQLVIKTLNHLQQNRSDFVDRQERFVNEAMILKGCHHPHIVEVYELIQENGLWGMVMEYIEGKELAHYADEKGQMSETEALGYIDQVGKAIEYCHKQGFLHRDIKPSNILLRHDSKEAVLIDFGLATQNNNTNIINFTTAGYAPPEQHNSGDMNYYSDIYALGATCYYLLTAQVPIPATFRTYAEMPPPKYFNDRVSDQVNAAILQAMAQEPRDRPQNVEEFRKLLGLDEEVLKLEDQRAPLHSYPNMGNDWQSTIVVATRFSDVDIQTTTIDNSPKTEKVILRSGGFWQGRNIELEMVNIPGGDYLMGSNGLGSISREGPQHLVIVPPFQIGKFPITQAQYFAVMDQNPAGFRADRRPVENVSWYDAMTFCTKISERLGKFYRLPSEAEWEYACRANTHTAFSLGDSLYPNLANYDSSNREGKFTASLVRRSTSYVDIFPANPFGLHDLHGNVWEWCADYQHEDYVEAPSDGSSWRIGGDPGLCILRGGAWGCLAQACRSSARHWAPVGYRSNKVGFRVVCDIKV